MFSFTFPSLCQQRKPVPKLALPCSAVEGQNLPLREQTSQGPRHVTPDNAEDRVHTQQRQTFGGRSGGERRSSREEHVRNSRGEESKGPRTKGRDRRRPNDEDTVADNHDVSSVDQDTQSVSSVEGVQKRRRRPRRNRHHSRTPSENTGQQAATLPTNAPTPASNATSGDGGQMTNNQQNKQMGLNSKAGTPLSEPKVQREPKSRSSRPPQSKRGENVSVQETMVNGTSI